MLKREVCHECNGLGIVALYSAFDFEGPGTCPTCKGWGTVLSRDTKGRFVKVTEPVTDKFSL